MISRPQSLVDSQRLSSIKIPTRRPRLQFKPTSQKMLRVATVARRLAEAEMVKCEGCNTWQHLSCYYVNGLTPSDHVCEAAAAAAGHDAGPSHSPGDAEILSKSQSCDPTVHVAVYARADKLGIPSIKTLACQKFMNVARKVADKNFAGLLCVVHENAAAQDSLLRIVATQHLANLETKIQDIPELIEVLQEHEPMAWAIIERLAKKLATAAIICDEGPSALLSAEREKKELLLEQYRLKSALQATEANLKETREKLSKRGMAFNKHAEDFNTLTAFVEGGKTFSMGCGKPLAKVAVKCARDGRVMIECRDSFCYFKNTI
jgi:hypothetical protein